MPPSNPSNFFLSDAQQTEWSSLINRASEAFRDLQLEIDNANRALQEGRDLIQGASDIYNEAISNLVSFSSARADEWRDEFNDRSEHWRESNEGSGIDTFIDDWHGLSAVEYEAEFPDDFDAADDQTISDAAELGSEP
jgi:uncharacterized protein YukE